MTLNAFFFFNLLCSLFPCSDMAMLKHEVLARPWAGVCASIHCFKFALLLSASCSPHKQHFCMILCGLNIQTNHGKSFR